ncbi:MAG: AMP-binding protein [Oscillospiraceae bacterium]|nr:AMP-binding protein [Oscillospiraceae bacterium]
MALNLNKQYVEIFDNIKTIPALIEYVTNHYGEQPAVINKDKQNLETMSFNKLKIDSSCVASLLIQKKIQGKPIAIVGNLCYEWLISYFGIVSSGNIAVPIDKELSETDIEKLMRQVDVCALFIDSSLSEKAVYFKRVFKEIETFISYGELDGYENVQSCLDKIDIVNDVIVHPEQTAMLVFTSGTTGYNKAVPLSHRNICDNLCCCIHLLEGYSFNPGDCTIPVLPPHHMFEVTTGLLGPLYYGGALCFGGGVTQIANSIKFFKPIALIVVPMIVEVVYKRISIEISKKGKEKQFKLAVKFSNFLRKFKIDLRRSIFKDIHDKFGGNLQVMICGGSFLESDLIKKYDDIGISILNGYGITECSPVVACNMKENRKLGSVGVIAPSPYCHVKIVEGEIWVKGSIVMSGYYNDADATEQSFEDGWFKTGDLGYLDDDGFLFITGRKKNLIILSDGNNISPEELEVLLENIPLIKSVFVCGKEHKNTVVITACINPDFEYANERGITDIQQNIEGEIARVNESLPPHKKIQKVEIYENEFEKTPLGKVKRYKHM